MKKLGIFNRKINVGTGRTDQYIDKLYNVCQKVDKFSYLANNFLMILKKEQPKNVNREANR